MTLHLHCLGRLGTNLSNNKLRE